MWDGLETNCSVRVRGNEGTCQPVQQQRSNKLWLQCMIKILVGSIYCWFVDDKKIIEHYQSEPLIYMYYVMVKVIVCICLL